MKTIPDTSSISLCAEAKASAVAELRTCSRCRRTLPLATHFYVDTHAGRAESHCKECRREAARRRRAEKRLRCLQEQLPQRRAYPVITQIEDPELRHELLHRALDRLRANVAERARKLREAEYERTA